MTRKQFIERAIRQAEKRLGIPVGWWGVYLDVQGPRGQRVHFGQMNGCRCWIVSKNGKKLTGHDGRRGAIAKAVKL